MCIVPFVLCLVRCFAKDSKISTKLMQQKSPLGFNILQRNPIPQRYGEIPDNKKISILAEGCIFDK